jgi:hypothetical protein
MIPGGSENSNGSTKNEWVNVTSDSPCVICNKDHWCSRSSDGRIAICRRSSTSAHFGAGREKTNANGDLYWVYRLSSTASPPGPEPAYRPVGGKGERAEPEILHAVYSALLQALPLTHEHRMRLRTRGLSNEVIDELGYRSLSRGRASAVRKLIEAGLEEHLPRVPGFYVRDKDDRSSFWTLSGQCGILIPVRDRQGRVLALLIRSDAEDTPNKYTFLSSKRYGGPGPGSPVHIPLHKPSNLTVVRVSEGALKSDIATFRSNLLTIGLPGVGAWARAGKALKELGATTARLAIDADARINRTVASALSRLATDLRSAGFTVELERWDIADGKGIDDLLVAGKAPEIVGGDAVTGAIEEIVVAAAKADPPPGLILPEGKPLEAEDDPHRLAALFRQKGFFDFGK